MVRTVAERALARHGYVLVAENGEEALEILERGGQGRPDDLGRGHADHGRPDHGARRAQDPSRAADPVHLRLCRGAAAEVDRPPQRLASWPSPSRCSSWPRRCATCSTATVPLRPRLIPWPPAPTAAKRADRRRLHVLFLAETASASAHGQRSILIVEDEPLIAMMLEDFLETLGHDVVGTCDPSRKRSRRSRPAASTSPSSTSSSRTASKSGRSPTAWPKEGMPFILATGGHVEPPPERMPVRRSCPSPIRSRRSSRRWPAAWAPASQAVPRG